MVDDAKIIGENIRKMRKERGMTQVRLANDLGITVATLSSYENGKTTPSSYLVKQMAWHLNTTVARILEQTQAKDTFGYVD